MAFLTPLFLVGLAGLAVPVIVHLIQRERKNVVAFPSLMFLRRIPYESVRRRSIRHWPLLLLRLAALALIVAAFGRPFLRRPLPGAAAAGGAREVILLVDRSYSMAYGDRWARALAAGRRVLDGLGPADRGSIVFFATGAEVALRSAPDRGRLDAALVTERPGAGATRYGPALKLAGSIASESPLPRREIVLISDFQRGGWTGADGVRLPDGVVLVPQPVGDRETANVSVTPVSIERSTFSDQERVTIVAGAVNHGAKGIPRLELVLELEGRQVQAEAVSLEPNGSASVRFAAFSPPPQGTRGTVRLAPDALAADNAFHFVVAPRRPLRVLIAGRPGSARDGSLYLSRALAVGENPSFDAASKSIDAMTTEDLQRAAVVILNDAPVTGAAAERLGGFVARGGGLLIAAAEAASWPAPGRSAGAADILPGIPGPPVDRSTGPAGRLGMLEYGHAIFEPFRAARTGDFSSARVYRYRSVVPVKDAQIIARFDDGAPALIERRVGSGRVLLWASSLDLQWNELPLKSVFLPFVHRMAATLGAYRDTPAWQTVGAVLDPPRAAAVPGRRVEPGGRVVLTPAGRRVPLDGEGPGVVELQEPGFYEVRAQGRDAAPPVAVASNVDLSESDLSQMDPQEVVAAATGRAGGAAAAGTNVVTSDAERERSQRGWWYLLFAGIVLLAVETVVGNRLPASGRAAWTRVNVTRAPVTRV